MPFQHVLLAAALVAGGLAGSLTAAHAQSEARTALIIGNGGYSYSKLDNPVNDARDMADALRGAGFEVILKTDADQSGMKDAIHSFGSSLKTKGGVGLLFYAGHGVQLNGENYILPLGERPSSEVALKNGAVTAAEAVDAMTAARNGLNIVILDACRDNPLQAGTTRGLSRIDSSSSLFVSFSTSPGEVALDGSGRNSPYTKHLKGAVGASNLTLEDTFKRTLKGVYQETGGKQQPWISSSFFGEFVFRPGARPATATAPVVSACVGASAAAAATAGRPSQSAADGARHAVASRVIGARRALSRRRKQSERQPLPRHGGADAGRRSIPLHLVGRASGVLRRRRVCRPDAGGELGRQEPGHLHPRSQRRSVRRMGRRQRDRTAGAVRARR